MDTSIRTTHPSPSWLGISLMMMFLATLVSNPLWGQVNNFSFEWPGTNTVIDQNGSVPGWKNYGGTALVTDADGAFHGKFALLLKAWANEQSHLVGQAVLQAGNTYQVSFRVRSTSCGPGSLIVKAGNGGAGSETLTRPGVFSDSWEEVTLTYTPQRDYSEIAFILTAKECPTYFYLDDIKIRCATGINVVANSTFAPQSEEEVSKSALINGSIPGWTKVTGSPDYYFSVGGDQRVVMWSDNNNGEAIVGQVQLKKGNRYTLKIRLRANTPPKPAEFFVVATLNKPTRFAIHGNGAQVLLERELGPALEYIDGVTLTTTFVAEDDYPYLLIYPYKDTRRDNPNDPHEQALLSIISVEVNPYCSQCSCPNYSDSTWRIDDGSVINSIISPGYNGWFRTLQDSTFQRDTIPPFEPREPRTPPVMEYDPDGEHH